MPGCNLKTEHPVQTNTPQIKLPTQTSLPQNNSSHIIVQPTLKSERLNLGFREKGNISVIIFGYTHEMLGTRNNICKFRS